MQTNRGNFLVIALYISASICSAVRAAPEEPLFLTPYINGGQIDEARALAAVSLADSDLESYSGFITVNQTHNTNIFFWFFPAAVDPSTAPVIIWCEGGPGVSGLFSLFNENGPYIVSSSMELQLRNYSWHKTSSMIFLDNPVGTGFSFSDSKDGWLTSGTDPAHLHNFLVQFFTMFPTYRENEFYAAGVSFGGTFAPTIAHRIHSVNQEGGFKINMKGLFVESPMCDPMTQMDYGSFLYHVGLLDDSDRDHVVQQTQLIQDLLEKEDYVEAYKVWSETIWLDDSFLFNRTGLHRDAVYNYMSLRSTDLGYENYVPFVEQESVRNALHVGELPFIPHSPDVTTNYLDRGLKTVKPLLEELLDSAEGYRILFYAGQLDIITYHLGVKGMLKGLEWNGKEGFGLSKPGVWSVEEEVAGWATTFGNLTYVLMRNAGHDANADQPQWGFDVMTRVTRNFPFTK